MESTNWKNFWKFWEKISFMILIENAFLMGAVVFIALIYSDKINLVFPQGSVFVIGIPTLITLTISYFTTSVMNGLFNLFSSKNSNDLRDCDGIIANKGERINQFINMLVSIKHIKWPSAVGILSIIFGIAMGLGASFSIANISAPNMSLSSSNKFYPDPGNVTGCIPNIDAGCPLSFQSVFRSQWLNGALSVLSNGVQEDLSVNWGDIVEGRIVMVATANNDTNEVYNTVRSDSANVPAFIVTVNCITSGSDPPKFPCQGDFRPLKDANNELRVPGTQLETYVTNGIELDGVWFAEVYDLQQDRLNETTKLSVNFVYVSPKDGVNCTSSNNETSGDFKLCRDSDLANVTCFMNTHMELGKIILAGDCENKDCSSEGLGLSCSSRINSSSPKPVYGDYIHPFIASYEGNILIPKCEDNPGCLYGYVNNRKDEVLGNFSNLLIGIVAEGVLSRRRVLHDINIPSVEVSEVLIGTVGTRLIFGTIYLSIVIASVASCLMTTIGWFIYRGDFKNEDRVSWKKLFREKERIEEILITIVPNDIHICNRLAELSKILKRIKSRLNKIKKRYDSPPDNVHELLEVDNSNGLVRCIELFNDQEIYHQRVNETITILEYLSKHPWFNNPEMFGDDDIYVTIRNEISRKIPDFISNLSEERSKICDILVERMTQQHL